MDALPLPVFDVAEFDTDEYFAVRAIHGGKADATMLDLQEWQELRLGMSDVECQRKIIEGCQKLEARGYLMRTGPMAPDGTIPYRARGRLVMRAVRDGERTPEQRRILYGDKES